MLPWLAALLVTQAPTGEGWRLTWTAPPECTQGAELGRAVEKKVGRALFSEPARLVVTGEVTRAEGEWRASLTLADSGGVVLGSREVSTKDPSCPALDPRTVLVLGLLINPLGGPGPIVALPAPLPALPAPAPVELTTARRDEVRVHLEANVDDVRLVELVDEGAGPRTGSRWVGRVERCVAPCDVPLLRAPRYVLGGPHVGAVEVSLREVLGSAVTVRVTTGSAGARALSVLGLTLGTALLVTSVVLFAVGATSERSSGGVVGGLLLAPLGAIALGAGVYGLSVTATKVTYEPRGAPPR